MNLKEVIVCIIWEVFEPDLKICTSEKGLQSVDFLFLLEGTGSVLVLLASN